MKVPSQRIRRMFWLSAAAATVAAMVVPAVTSSVAAQSASLSGHPSDEGGGGGYPPPGGIYKPFTDCPLKNPLMHEANGFVACTAANAPTGSIKIGNLTTPVTQPVQVQFGFWTPPNQTYFADVVPPPAGVSAQLVSKPDLVPDSLTTALGCPSSDSTVQNLCQEAQRRGGRFNQIFALAKSAGTITNFTLLSWTQPVKFQLVNPLLGNNCYIGTGGDPVVLNPSLTISSATIEPDPKPAAHPDTSVLVAQASANDTTFTAPGVTGCGPGGVANIAVDQALDTSAGLPAASGTNSFTLTGTFSIAVCQASTDSSVPQPADDAAILLSAFKASTREGGGDGGDRLRRLRITVGDLKRMLDLPR